MSRGSALKRRILRPATAGWLGLAASAAVAGAAVLVALVTPAAPAAHVLPSEITSAGFEFRPIEQKKKGPDESSCTIVAVPVVFGSYNVTSPAPLDSYSLLWFNCGEDAVHHVRIEIGAGFSGMIAARRMQGPGGYINYNLYLDAVRQVIWGDGSQGSQTFEMDNPAPNQDHMVPIYGRVPPMQAVSQGHYDDALTVTILF